ncbi:hypothetical protein ACI8AC_12140 [Geodermatophilus sp. SYSU D00758]
MTRPQPDPAPPGAAEGALRDVDSAALVLAGLAGSVVLFTGEGDWDAFGTVVGCLIVLVVLAFHRPVRAARAARRTLLRLAFGAVVAVGVAAAVAWPVQEWMTHDAARATDAVAWTIGPLAVVLAALEPQTSRWLGPE